MSNAINKPPTNTSLSPVKGQHAIIEHAGAISHLGCAELEALLSQAAIKAGATILGADFHNFGEGMGNTGVLILAESHMSVHTWPENNYAAIDIFLCSAAASASFKPIEVAIDVLKLADQHGSFDIQIIHRSVPAISNNSPLQLSDNIIKNQKRGRTSSADVAPISRINREST